MKLPISICLFCSLLLVSSCTKKGETDFRRRWQDPPLEFRMNRNLHNFPLDTSGQDSLIELTLDNGWGGFALNVPFSDYLTDEGMKATKRFCEKAKAKGMDLWLYDEKGYPSGNAGDLVIKEDPTWESMGIYMKDSIVNGGSISFLMPPGEVIYMIAFPVVGGQTEYGNPSNLQKHIKGSHLEWDAPTGAWNLFAATKYVLYEGFQAFDKGGSKMGSQIGRAHV